MRFRKLFILLIILTFVLTACDQNGTEGTGDMGSRKINVVTTTSMIGDLANVIGGERVAVTGLMGPGIDPHLYKASAGDVNRLQEADIIFYNGLHLEAAMGEVLEQMEGRKKTVAVGDAVDKTKLLAPPEFKGAFDPHIWFDVTMWMPAAERVRDSLSELDPTHAETYKANAQKHRDELAELHDYVKSQAEKVPDNLRVLVTAHDAFNYFGRAYGFEVRGLQGISTASEAGAADVQALAAFIAERKIPSIFVESSVPARNIEALQAAVKSRGHNVTIGGQLFSDALGDKGKLEGTYVGMVRYNIDTIVKALAP